MSAREKRTGLEQSIAIDNVIARFERDTLDEARHRVQSLFGEQQSQGGSAGEHRRLGVEAGALVGKAERLLEKASAEDAEDLVDAIEAVKDALSGEEAPLRAAMDGLADLLYYLQA